MIFAANVLYQGVKLSGSTANREVPCSIPGAPLVNYFVNVNVWEVLESATYFLIFIINTQL